MIRTHEHQYLADTRPEWGGGVVCRICGFRVPPNLAGLSAVRERLVKPTQSNSEEEGTK